MRTGGSIPIRVPAALLVVFAGACTIGTSPEDGPSPSSPEPRPAEESTAPPPGAGDGGGPATPGPVADPEAVGANELGGVPVIMYHRVVEDGGPEYDIEPELLLGELELLYRHGYRPVRTVDLVDGAIDVPPGTSPVVLTFDDSSPSQFGYAPDGGIDPDTAIGILLEFARRHPDFAPTASLYVNENPFGVAGERARTKLEHLHRMGFELGNHTLGHGNLRTLGPEGARRDLALGASSIVEAVPRARVRTLALPYGVFPDDRAIAHAGEHDGFGYRHDGILLVGAGPSPSPFDTEFDPLAIPRIRTQPVFDPDEDEPDLGSGYWLWRLEQEPGLRYVSDGSPRTISFPAELADRLAPEYADRANPY